MSVEKAETFRFPQPFKGCSCVLCKRGGTKPEDSQDVPVFSAYKLVKVGDWSQLEILANDFSFYAVTSTPSAEVESISAKLDLDYQFLAGDEIMLKTIVRSNPGFMLVKNGAILGKWSYRDLPSLDQLDPQITELIGNASAPMDDEAQMLMDAGVYDEFSFDVIEFDSYLPGLVLKEGAAKRDKGVSLAFILSMLVVLLLSGYISQVKV